jgi:hypothetical protein
MSSYWMEIKNKMVYMKIGVWVYYLRIGHMIYNLRVIKWEISIIMV